MLDGALTMSIARLNEELQSKKDLRRPLARPFRCHPDAAEGKGAHCAIANNWGIQQGQQIISLTHEVIVDRSAEGNLPAN
jgi:hypothetical protein